MGRYLWLAALACIALALASCGRGGEVVCEYCEQRARMEEEYVPPPPRLVYVALGDSVSEGFGIWAAADRHTAVFFETLRERGYVNEYVNMAVSGFTTTDLLGLLRGLGAAELDALGYAAIITLNIGGNNVLAPFWAHLPDIEEMGRITDETMHFVGQAWELAMEIIQFAGESREAVDEVMSFAHEVMDFADNFSFMDVFRLSDMMAAATPVIDGAMEVFAEINLLEGAVVETFDRAQELEIVELFSLLSGNFPPELEAAFEASIIQFSLEFGQILTWIENNAPDAVVIVNTVYNPLPTHFIGLPIGFADESQRLIHSVNRIIERESTARGFIVSDVYTQLTHRLDMMNLSFDIIHPNPAGHRAIAEQNLSDFLNLRP